MSLNYIDEIFGEHGILSKELKGYIPRPGQIKMAKAIDLSFKRNDNLMVEGPTGTGKSLAYSVPAIYHALNNDVKVAIVTANIALQEQLVTKDLPFLSRVLPVDFTYSLIKGRNNYLCIDKWQSQLSNYSYKGKNTNIYKKVLNWGKVSKTGDRSELDFKPSYDVWSLFSITSDECKGKDCASYNECFVKEAKLKAEKANIFVTNYHMLFADLKVRMGSDNFVSVLPYFDYLICDEAHKAADIARDFFGFKLSEASIRFAGGALNRIKEHDLYETLQIQAAKTFFDVRKFYDSREYKTRFKKTPNNIKWKPFYNSLKDASRLIKDAIDSAPSKDEKASFRRALSSTDRMAKNLQEIMLLENNNMVYFIELLSNGAPILKGKPVFVDKVLSEHLFETNVSTILTSATLSVNGQFNHIKKDLGILSKDLIVSSPFNHNEQTLLVIPKTMPQPSNSAYSKAVADTVVENVKLAKGRTLALFTSYKNLNEAHNALLKANTGYNILRQGDVPRMMLLKQFKEDINSVLLGTESFWTGVDVPGESLSCVIIDRLPFPTPDDPVLDAITSMDRNWFMNYSIPRAIIAFKQGFGRLIRKVDDRGVVVILDRRLIVKSYGNLFFRSLPQTKKSQHLDSVNKFLYRMGK